MLAVYHPYVRCLPPLPMCPQFRKGDCQPFTLQKLTTGYKPITSSLQAAGLVTPQQARYKGFVKHYEGASFVTKLVTKLVMHYEYFARNEARYEARNASVHLGDLLAIGGGEQGGVGPAVNEGPFECRDAVGA